VLRLGALLHDDGEGAVRIPENQEFLDWITREYLTEPLRPESNGHARRNPGAAPELADEEIIERCRGARNAAKFASLFDHGDISAHHDHNRADLALMGMLAFYTDDPDQLERIFSRSALGRRAKWTRRADYRRMTIAKVLADPGRERYRGSFSSFHSPRGYESDENKTPADVVWFHELGEPKPRRHVIEKIVPKGYPVVGFGAGGVAKSLIMLAGGIGMASTSGVEEWLGYKILERGPVLYLDFELDQDEQHRRVRDLCEGMGVPIPKKLAYLSGVGLSTPEAFGRAYAFMEEYEPVAAIIDSVGLAMLGDMERSKDVLAFFREYVDPFRRAGVTPFLVDHEGKLQAGEKHKDKSPFGSANKAWSARSVLQFILDEYDEATSTIGLQVRHTKANFTGKIKPFGVDVTFEQGKIAIRTKELPDAELMEEEHLPVRDRILAALELEPQTIDDLVRLTGAAKGTIYNKLSDMQANSVVAQDGYRGQKKVYRLFSSSPPPPKESEMMKTTDGGEEF
jgi:AAA domain